MSLGSVASVLSMFRVGKRGFEKMLNADDMSEGTSHIIPAFVA